MRPGEKTDDAADNLSVLTATEGDKHMEKRDERKGGKPLWLAKDGTPGKCKEKEGGPAGHTKTDHLCKTSDGVNPSFEERLFYRVVKQNSRVKRNRGVSTQAKGPDEFTSTGCLIE